MPRRLATLILAAIGASGPAEGQYQPAAPTGGGIDVPSRGRAGWWSETSITTQATATNNANYGESQVREGDLIIQLVPAWNFHRGAARLSVDGSVSLDMIGYVWGVQTSRILPQADVRANLEAIENLFFIDASVLANQSIINPFLPRAEFSSTNNEYTYAQTRLRPYLTGNIGLNTTWLISSDNSYTWTTQTDNPLGNTYYGRQLAEVTRAPTPLGLTLRVSSDVTRIDNQLQPDQTLNTALAIVNYAFTPQFTFGLRGGYETTTYTAVEESGPIFGGQIAWRPTPISSLIGYWEERFYGPSYQFSASHRQRRLASSASFYRTITTYPQVLLQIPPTGSVAGLLDAILVARFPDPTVRQQQVQDLINRQGLPDALPAGAYIYNQSANILTGSNVNFALLGVRNTLALNLFYLKTALLPDPRVPPTFLAFNNNEQLGAGISLSHALTPTINLNSTLSGYETKGFGPSEGQETRQGLASLQVNWQLSLRDTVFVGTRYQYQRNIGPRVILSNSSEAAIFAGLFHSFGSIGAR
jgi:uncharacterized protein (PEP-CTERM system associated)